jgi:hypothetical protein
MSTYIESLKSPLSTRSCACYLVHRASGDEAIPECLQAHVDLKEISKRSLVRCSSTVFNLLSEASLVIDKNVDLLFRLRKEVLDAVIARMRVTHDLPVCHRARAHLLESFISARMEFMVRQRNAVRDEDTGLRYSSRSAAKAQAK